MGNFRSDSHGGFRNRSSGNRSGGSRFGGRSDGNRSGGSRFGERSGGRDGFRGRNSRRPERGPAEMHEITCDKCGKQCEVPFKPTGDKPVFCSDCFRKNSGSGNNSDSRDQNRTQSEVSSGQLNQINAKLDRIIKILQELEIDYEEDSEEEPEDDEDLDEDEEDSEDEELEEESGKSDEGNDEESEETD